MRGGCGVGEVEMSKSGEGVVVGGEGAVAAGGDGVVAGGDEEVAIGADEERKKRGFVRLKGVRKLYQAGGRKFWALDGVDLELEQGELVVILGPSGAGKSTLLNILGGIDQVTEGSVWIGEENIAKYDRRRLTKYRARDVGFIFQFYNILSTLTVEENVRLVEEVAQTTKSVEEVLRSVGLWAHRRKFPQELSGGEQQRVSIARAVMKNPKILLCDEPTGALDSKTGMEVLKLLRVQSDFDTTVVIVTHNALIAEVADRVIRIKNGKVESNEVNLRPARVEEVKW